MPNVVMIDMTAQAKKSAWTIASLQRTALAVAVQSHGLSALQGMWGKGISHGSVHHNSLLV